MIGSDIQQNTGGIRYEFNGKRSLRYIQWYKYTHGIEITALNLLDVSDSDIFSITFDIFRIPSNGWMYNNGSAWLNDESITVTGNITVVLSYNLYFILYRRSTYLSWYGGSHQWWSNWKWIQSWQNGKLWNSLKSDF